jgi:hypothetical protein
VPQFQAPQVSLQDRDDIFAPEPEPEAEPEPDAKELRRQEREAKRQAKEQQKAERAAAKQAKAAEAAQAAEAAKAAKEAEAAATVEPATPAPPAAPVEPPSSPAPQDAEPAELKPKAKRGLVVLLAITTLIGFGLAGYLAFGGSAGGGAGAIISPDHGSANGQEALEYLASQVAAGDLPAAAKACGGYTAGAALDLQAIIDVEAAFTPPSSSTLALYPSTYPFYKEVNATAITAKCTATLARIPYNAVANDEQRTQRIAISEEQTSQQIIDLMNPADMATFRLQKFVEFQPEAGLAETPARIASAWGAGQYMSGLALFAFGDTTVGTTVSFLQYGDNWYIHDFGGLTAMLGGVDESQAFLAMSPETFENLCAKVAQWGKIVPVVGG